MNPALQMAIDKAKSENMPKDNIRRAIARGSGSGSDLQVEKLFMNYMVLRSSYSGSSFN